jgi:hypothetical protein
MFLSFKDKYFSFECFGPTTLKPGVFFGSTMVANAKADKVFWSKHLNIQGQKWRIRFGMLDKCMARRFGQIGVYDTGRFSGLEIQEMIEDGAVYSVIDGPQLLVWEPAVYKISQ